MRFRRGQHVRKPFVINIISWLTHTHLTRKLNGNPPTYTGAVTALSDKRRRRDLDLFVLALIDSGISTPYELMTAADLSPGATIPALRRLASEGLAIQAKPGSRGRTAHKITAAGRWRLKDGWKELVEQGPSGDLDADLRVALLALWIGHDRQLAASFLRQSAAERLSVLDGAENRDEPDSLPPLALWYRRLRSASAAALTKAESAAALAMAKALPRGSSAKSRRSRTKANP
jgi:DNA-binding PadR family transcriptional regulator